MKNRTLQNFAKNDMNKERESALHIAFYPEKWNVLKFGEWCISGEWEQKW